MRERAFGLLKPDCLKRDLVVDVLSMVTGIGLEIIAIKRVRLIKEEVDLIWNTCRKESYYSDLVAFFTTDDCVVFVIEGEQAMACLKELVGHWDPLRAQRGTIRNKFGTSPMTNIIHSADDAQETEKEMSIFFRSLCR